MATTKILPTYFSRRTPLNFFALFLTVMNWPPFLLRFVEVFVSGFFNCVRFFTAPLRALSPLGLFTDRIDMFHEGNGAGSGAGPLFEDDMTFGEGRLALACRHSAADHLATRALLALRTEEVLKALGSPGGLFKLVA